MNTNITGTNGHSVCLHNNINNSKSITVAEFTRRLRSFRIRHWHQLISVFKFPLSQQLTKLRDFIRESGEFLSLHIQREAMCRRQTAPVSRHISMPWCYKRPPSYDAEQASFRVWWIFKFGFPFFFFLCTSLHLHSGYWGWLWVIWDPFSAWIGS